MIVVENQTFPSIQALADAYNLKASTINEYRKRHNLTWDAVVQHYVSKKPRIVFSYQGQNFSTMKQAYRYYGYTERQIASCAYIEELTTKEALIGYLEKQFPLNLEFVKVGRVTYPTLYKCLQAFQIDFKKFHHEKDKEINEQETTESLILEILSSDYYYERHREVFDYFATKGLSRNDLVRFVQKSGLPLTKIQTYYQKHEQLPSVVARGEFYIQYHTFTSIPLACCYFDLDITAVRRRMEREKSTWNGVIAQLLKENQQLNNQQLKITH